MPQRRSRRVAVTALVAVALAGLSGCTPASTAPGGPTLRETAPDRLLIGSAVAGGGHHTQAGYPPPFTDDDDYRDLLASEFSSLTPENQLKWDAVHPRVGRYDFRDVDKIVDFAAEHGQKVRGHTLLWHNQNPAWLTSHDYTDDQLYEILHEHISEVVGHFAGKIYQWDVANEIFDDNAQLRTTDNIWLKHFGVGIIGQAFRWAHEADPDAVLFLNDYNVESIGPKSDAYYDLAKQLLAEGVPLGGFAVQGHLSLDYPFPSDLKQNLQRFSDLGLEVAVTELDIRMPVDGEPTAAQLAEQAQWYSDVLDACLSVSSCTSFTIWGAPDKYSWVPSFFTGEGAATPWRDDFSRKPAYDALLTRLREG